MDILSEVMIGDMVRGYEEKYERGVQKEGKGRKI